MGQCLCSGGRRDRREGEARLSLVGRGARRGDLLVSERGAVALVVEAPRDCAAGGGGGGGGAALHARELRFGLSPPAAARLPALRDWLALEPPPVLWIPVMSTARADPGLDLDLGGAPQRLLREYARVGALPPCAATLRPAGPEELADCVARSMQQPSLRLLR